jgi:hypothetical protein
MMALHTLTLVPLRETPRVEEAPPIEQTVARLNGLCRLQSLELTLAVGQVIVEDLYGGDLDAWRSRGPKDHSFRKLAAHEGLQLSAAVLARSTGIYEMMTRLVVSTWRHLGPSHLRAALQLPGEAQSAILAQADREGWTATEMERRCREARPRDPEGARPGRRPMPVVVKRLTKVNRLIDEALSAGVEDDLLSDWPVERLAVLLDESERRILRLRELCDLLDTRISEYGEE